MKLIIKLPLNKIIFKFFNKIISTFFTHSSPKIYLFFFKSEFFFFDKKRDKETEN